MNNGNCAKCGGAGQVTIVEYGVMCTAGCCVAFLVPNGMKFLRNKDFYCYAPKQKIAAVALCQYCQDSAELCLPTGVSAMQQLESMVTPTPPPQSNPIKRSVPASQVKPAAPVYVHRNASGHA